MSRLTLKISAMATSPAGAAVRLPSGRGLSLVDAAGVVVTALRGRVWLTMEGEGRDIDLERGTTYTIERDGLTLLNALEPSVVQVRIAPSRRAAWRGWPARFWAWLARIGEARARARIARGAYRW